MENKKMFYLVIVLSVLVVVLGGYIVYDKVMSTDNNSDEINNDIGNNNINYISGYLLDMMNENDKNKLDENVNYQNVQISVDDLSFTFNCTGFGGAPGDYCYHTEILLNGNKVHEYDTVLGDINTNPYIITTEKYLMVQRTDSYEIEIFDKTGNSLVLVNNVVYSYSKDSGVNYIKEPMYLDNNKLYFNTYEPKDLSDSSLDEITLKHIDLSTSVFNIVSTDNVFRGVVSCKEC